ncbi:MAG: hypothetical protein K2L50_02660 [Bacteroidales bacterium]|nr:hypothetical protein [Bacteroidales bacterium]
METWKKRFGETAGLLGRYGNKRIFLWYVCISATIAPLRAQDFTDIGKRNPFSFSGTAGTQIASRWGSDGGSDPFSYLVFAQLNPSLYGISLPFSFSWADSRFSYGQPFSRISFNPSYKWIKTQIGRTSMDMHPYGLSGQQFDGAGFCLEPTSFPLRFSAMYGRLVKARHGDTVPQNPQARETALTATSYKRTGYAFRLGFSHNRQEVNLHFFKATDHRRSLPEAWQKESAPEENAVLALDFSFDLYRGLLLNGQAGLSAFTADQRTPGQKLKGFWAGLSRPFLKQRSSTSFSTAYKIGLTYKSISIHYERISPNYRTLGAAYFDQDFENAVVSFSHGFKKVDLNAEIGWQRDDLHNTKAERMNRMVGSAYLNYRIDECFSLMASYSNFTVYTQMKPVDLSRPDDPFIEDPDTVAYRQVAQQALFGFNFHTASTAPVKQEAGLDISYQSSRQRVQQTFSDYVYAAVRHGIELPHGYRLLSSFNFSTQIDRSLHLAKRLAYNIGPQFTCTRSLFNKDLLLSAGLSYYLDMQGQTVSGGIADLRLRGTYTLRKCHEFEMQVNGRLRSVFKAGGKSGKEIFLQAGYRYRFNLSPFEKQKEKTKKARRNPDPDSENVRLAYR